MPTISERRPNPDELLAAVRQQEAKRQRGRLKVFFGMSAGVGKTYAMIEEARSAPQRGWMYWWGMPSRTSVRRLKRCSWGSIFFLTRSLSIAAQKLKELDLDGRWPSGRR